MADALESGALEPLLLEYPRPEYGIHVVRPPGAHVPGKVRVLIDSLVERFGGTPDLGSGRLRVAAVPRGPSHLRGHVPGFPLSSRAKSMKALRAADGLRRPG